MAALIKGQLLKHLSKFTKNLSSDKIDLSVLKGEGDLFNLELDEVVLTDVMGLPPWLRISRAVCNRVTIKLMDEIRVEIETCQRLPSTAAVLQNGSNAKYGMVDQIIDGLSLSINSVIISFKSLSFSATIQLTRVTVRSKTPLWQDGDQLRMTRIKNRQTGEVLLFKEAAWQTMRIEANALKTADPLVNTTPLRLITNRSKLRITVKKKLIDCCLIAARLEFNLDDLIWVLTDSQLSAALSFVNSLSDTIQQSTNHNQESTSSAPDQKTEPIPPSDQATSSHRLKPPVYSSSSLGQGSSGSSDRAKMKLFEKHNIDTTSYHVYTGRIDLHLCDDVTSNDVVGYTRRVDDGAIQLTLSKLDFDFYPLHPAGGGRELWPKYDNNMAIRDLWVENLNVLEKTPVLMKSAQSDADPVHIRIDAQMPCIILPSLDRSRHSSDSLFDGLRIQISKLSATNTRPAHSCGPHLETRDAHVGPFASSDSNLEAAVKRFSGRKLFATNNSEFPRCANDRITSQDSLLSQKSTSGIPASDTTSGKSTAHETCDQTETRINTAVEGSFHQSGVWCMDVQQLWVEFVFMQRPSMRTKLTQSFIEPFSITLWIISQKPRDDIFTTASEPMILVDKLPELDVLDRGDSFKAKGCMDVNEGLTDQRRSEHPAIAQPACLHVLVVTDHHSIKIQLNHDQLSVLLTLVDTATHHLNEIETDIQAIKKVSPAVKPKSSKRLEIWTCIEAVQIALVFPVVALLHLRAAQGEGEASGDGDGEGEEGEGGVALPANMEMVQDGEGFTEVDSPEATTPVPNIAGISGSSPLIEDYQTSDVIAEHSVDKVDKTRHAARLVSSTESARTMDDNSINMQLGPDRRESSLPVIKLSVVSPVKKNSVSEAFSNFSTKLSDCFKAGSPVHKAPSSTLPTNDDTDSLDSASLHGFASDDDDDSSIFEQLENQSEQAAFERQPIVLSDVVAGRGLDERHLAEHPIEEQVSVLVVTLSPIETLIQCEGHDLSVMTTVTDIQLTELKELALDKFQIDFISGDSYATFLRSDTTHTLSEEPALPHSFPDHSPPSPLPPPPSPPTLHARFDLGPTADLLCPESKGTSPGSAGTYSGSSGTTGFGSGGTGYLRALVRRLHTKLGVLTLSNLSDLFEDVLASPSMLPMNVEISDICVSLINDKPRVYPAYNGLPSNMSPPMDINIHRAVITRDDRGVFHIAASSSNDVSSNIQHSFSAIGQVTRAEYFQQIIAALQKHAFSTGPSQSVSFANGNAASMTEIIDFLENLLHENERLILKQPTNGLSAEKYASLMSENAELNRKVSAQAEQIIALSEEHERLIAELMELRKNIPWTTGQSD